MARERSDKKKNTAKIVKAYLKSPTKSQREIAQEVWLSRNTVQKTMDKVDSKLAKDDRIQWICEMDLQIIRLWQAELSRRLSDSKELKKMRSSEISQVIKENTARYTLFKWDVTDKEWWLNQITWITINLDE